VRWVRVEAPPRAEADRLDRAMTDLRYRVRAAAGWPVHVTPTPDVDSLAVRVWSMRVAPLEPLLGGIRELVVVSPTLHWGLPLELLRDDSGRWLADRFTISYAPSAVLSVLGRSRPAPADDPRRWSALLVGSPGPGPAGAAGGGLPGIRREIENVRSRIADARVLVGAAATEAALTRLRSGRALEHFDLVHIAAHQDADSRFPRQTALLLADAAAAGPGVPPLQVDSTDGRITPDEVAGWRLRARLAMMASCQSMGYPTTRSEGTVGLGQALMEAGARSIVVSAWPVEDRATELLVERFYEELIPRAGRGRTIAEALRAARRHVREWRAPDGSQPYLHPAYWAGFIVYGDPG
jgi:CHAT domain-containing protein